MNLTELIGIAGCPHESGRRRAEENQSDIGESQSEGRNSAALRVLAQYRKRCSPIPENLWSSAVEMAREHGLNRTARTLRLNTPH